LLELVVAIGIFALMAAFAYSGLASVLNLSAATQLESQRLGEVQRAIARLERDLETAVVRQPLPELGGELEPAFEAGGSLLFRFTRSGVPNPLKLARSDLQRVAWAYSGGELLRVAWPQLDPPVELGPPAAEQVLTDVSEVEVLLRDARGEPHTQWPPLGQENASGALPRAVDVRITLGDWGLIRRLIVLPEGPGGAPQLPG
jgi:general secretion pathway protein J